MPGGKILMLPMPIGPLSLEEMRSDRFMHTIANTRFWVAENARTTRRFISSLKLGITLQDLQIFELDQDFSQSELSSFLNTNITSGNIAVTSEAGLPGMADPGAAVAQWAHKTNTEIITFSGPGSVYLALCASGLNGQQFTFHGYCPIKDDALQHFISDIGQQALKTGYTQIFIETPYRSDRVLAALLKYLPENIFLCVAAALHSDASLIKTKTIPEWRKTKLVLGKQPAVFLVGHGSS